MAPPRPSSHRLSLNMLLYTLRSVTSAADDPTAFMTPPNLVARLLLKRQLLNTRLPVWMSVATPPMSACGWHTCVSTPVHGHVHTRSAEGL